MLIINEIFERVLGTQNPNMLNVKNEITAGGNLFQVSVKPFGLRARSKLLGNSEGYGIETT